MGFFSKIFKKKKGGTFFGNLIRGVASTATGGVLGSGKKLAEWQAKEEQKEYEQALAEQQALIKNSAGYKQGADIAQPFSGVLTDSPEAKKLQNNQVKAWLKRNWYIVAIPVVALVGAVIYFARRK